MTTRYAAPAPATDESENEYMDRCMIDNPTENEEDRRSECQGRWDDSMTEDDDGPPEGPPPSDGPDARNRVRTNQRITGGGPMGIKEIKQERADLLAEQSTAKAAVRDLLDASMDDTVRMTQINPHEGRIEAIDERLVTLASLEAVWERNKDDQAIAPAARRGNDRPTSSRVSATPSHGVDSLYGDLGEQMTDIRRAAMGDGEARERLLNSFAQSPQGLNASMAGLGAEIGVDSEGGFLVHTDFSNNIFEIMHRDGVILNDLTALPLNGQSDSIELDAIDETSRADGSRGGGIQAFWVSEGTAPTATKPTFRQIQLKLRKVMALGYATDELLAHSAVMAVRFTNGFANELRFKVEDAVYEGDGVGKPRGILNSPGTIEVAKQGGADPATITHEDLIAMWTRLHASMRAGAKWYINQDTEPQLDQLAKVIGVSGIEPNYVTYGPDGVLRIKGRPVEIIEYASTLGTVGDIVLANIKDSYAYITDGSMKQDRSIHVRFTTGEEAFRASMRVDGESYWVSPMTPFKGTSTTSAVIKLASRL